MRRYRFRWFHPLAVALVAAMTFSTLDMLRAEPPTTPKPRDAEHATRAVPPPPGTSDFRTAEPPRGTIASGYGIVEPNDRETKVAAAVAGRITRVAVVEGQKVAVGDTLVELDSSVEQAAVAAAHLFNHQTHHRGQVHVMLSQTAVAPPSLDLHRIVNS